MCDKCKEFGGWVFSGGGMKRCECTPIVNLQNKIPTLTAGQCSVFVEMLAVMNFFPQERGARALIGDELRVLCAGPVEAEWLVRRMCRLYQRWPGLQELRRVYCSKHIPHDGLLPHGISEHYPDGIPSEKQEQLALQAPELKRLPPGEPVIADKRTEAAFKIAATVQAIKQAEFSGPATAEEVATAPEWLRKLEGY